MLKSKNLLSVLARALCLKYSTSDRIKMIESTCGILMDRFSNSQLAEIISQLEYDRIFRQG